MFGAKDRLQAEQLAAENKTLRRHISHLKEELDDAVDTVDILNKKISRFAKITFALFKRTPHDGSCPALKDMSAECTCGLASLDLEIATQTAVDVYHAMTADQSSESPSASPSASFSQSASISPSVSPS